MDTAVPTGRGWLPRAVAFWLIVTIQFLLLFASSAPSPLYVIYQAEWRFSSATLTVVFAAYAIALLVALLVVGGLSDHVGRKPVLIAALIAEVLSMALFAGASGVGWLLAARVVQGIATGAATGATSAALIDLQPAGNVRIGPLANSSAPIVGLAVGALSAGLLVQYAPAPTVLVYVLLLAVFLLSTLLIFWVPETSASRTGALASLRPRLGVPPQARPMFLVVVPCLFAVWALGGLYLSLGPSLAVGILHIQNHVIGGLVIFTLAGTGAVGSLLLRDWVPRRAMLVGLTAFLIGVGVTLIALVGVSPELFLIGTAISGFGFGNGFLGAFRTVAALALPTERAQLFASMYIACYIGFSLPSIAAGIAVTAVGLKPTVIVYGFAVMLLAALAALGLLIQARRDLGRGETAEAARARVPAKSRERT